MASPSLAATPPRGVPLTLVGLGSLALLVGVAAGSRFTVASAIVFALACLLALRDTTAPIFTWPHALGLLVAIVWLIPIKTYTLPVNLPFQLETYRLCILLLLLALTVQLIVGTEHLRASGHAAPVALLVGAAVASLVVNAPQLNASALQQQAVKSTSYFVSFLIVFLLICSTVRNRDEIDRILMLLVGGGALVGLAAIYESRTHYNLFEHLQTVMP